MAIKLGITKDAAANMAAAIKSGDQAQIEQAWDVFHGSVVEQVKSDARELKNERDSRVNLNSVDIVSLHRQKRNSMFNLPISCVLKALSRLLLT